VTYLRVLKLPADTHTVVFLPLLINVLPYYDVLCKRSASFIICFHAFCLITHWLVLLPSMVFLRVAVILYVANASAYTERAPRNAESMVRVDFTLLTMSAALQSAVVCERK